jgi:hypothetical protein
MTGIKRKKEERENNKITRQRRMEKVSYKERYEEKRKMESRKQEKIITDRWKRDNVERREENKERILGKERGNGEENGSKAGRKTTRRGLQKRNTGRLEIEKV